MWAGVESRRGGRWERAQLRGLGSDAHTIPGQGGLGFVRGRGKALSWKQTQRAGNITPNTPNPLRGEHAIVQKDRRNSRSRQKGTAS